ncbi:MAG: hypothetical protein Q9O62_12390 [Ardenticatenia bacterium]|nr:hypothetical protein [Ardenticatenia bacterium]
MVGTFFRSKRSLVVVAAALLVMGVFQTPLLMARPAGITGESEGRTNTHIGQQAALASSVSITFTSEVSGNNHAGRQAAAALNDQWITDTRSAGLICFYQLDSIFAGGYFTYTAGTQAEITGTIGPFSVSISNRDMTNITDVNDIGQLGGDVVISSSLGKSLQDSAPMPDPDPAAPGGTHGWYQVSDGSAWEYWNENSGDTATRNGVLFTFSPPVPAFGAFFGDLETRTDGGGTPAELRYKVAGGSVITQSIPTSTSNQSICGSGVPGCGNQTTRWIGLRGTGGTVIEWVLVIVGDNNQVTGGNTEHISWVGATVATSPSGGGTCEPGTPAPTAVRLVSLSATTPGSPYWPITVLALSLAFGTVLVHRIQ